VAEKAEQADYEGAGMRKRLAVIFALAVVIGACGGGGGDIGQAGDASEAARTVEIRQLDTRKFEPAEVEVQEGETVTIRVTNTATALHEFFLGDEEAQKEHEEEMAAMGDAEMKMSDTEARLFMEPGETKQITWTFGDAGEVPFGCHMPGHYDGGMKGTFKVT
jgi:uncharacterized cupredoxin-like copper-binding protein